MTDRKQALQDLRDKVANGDELIQPWFFQDAFNNADHRNCAGEAFTAYHDSSLDAAKALHNAVLPGCSQYSIVTDPTCLKVSVCWWPNGLSGKTERHGEGWGHPDQEARAWLLAILSALIAQQTDTAKEAP